MRTHTLTLLLLLALPAAHAQSAPAAPTQSSAVPVPLYDVVTVKPSNSAKDSNGIDSTDSTYRAYNVSLRTLLINAYNVLPDLISGIPADLTDKRHDVNAKILDPDFKILEHLTDEQRREQVRAILTDRFHLLAHIEFRTLPVFDLTVLPSGPTFQHSPLKPDGQPDRQTNIRNRSLEAKGITLTNFCYSLSGQLHRTVIDRTGLTGPYDLTLHWSADDADPTTDPNPPLPTAIEEQLGLKLKAAKGPVPTLIVDRLTPPTAN